MEPSGITTPADAPDTLVPTESPTPLSTHYPLLERGFHFINEWRYAR